MKNYKSTLFALFMALGIFGFISCKETPVEPEEENSITFTLEDIAVESDFAFQEGDLENAFVIQPYGPEIQVYLVVNEKGDGKKHYKDYGDDREDNRECNKRGLGHYKHHHKHGHKHGKLVLGKVLVKLNLTEEQKTQIFILREEYLDCVKTQRAALYEALKPILEQANADRQVILTDLKDGKITREQAVTALKELNLKTRETIANSPEMAAAIEALKLCRETLFAGIAALLDDEQLQIWEEWVLKLTLD